MNDAPLSAPPTDAVKPMSLTDKIVGVLASPGELFDNVRLTPKTTSNWLVPTLILVLVGVLMSTLVLTNASLYDQYKHMADQQVEKSLQKQIAEGKITQQQADQAHEQMAAYGSIGIYIQRYGGAILGPFIALFLVSLLYWLLGKGVMKATAPYMKVAEVVGLTFFIGVIESIVTTMLSIGLNNAFASPSLALTISDFSIDNKMHLLAASMNVFTFWSLAVISIGLSRLFQKDFPKVAVLVFALWLLWTLFAVFVLTMLRA
ncbi:MAG TPA: YIP1 family protein [Bacteroidota bacterium]|nr:YIP1 family protein [Bacteroidota bacterium]